MDGTLDLKPLHGLYQVLNTAGGADLAHPLVCLAQLQRKPPGSRSPSPDPSQLGEVEWVVGLGTQRPAPVREGKKRRKRDETADVWWEARLCGREVEELLQQARAEISSLAFRRATTDKETARAGRRLGHHARGHGATSPRAVALGLR